MTVIVDLSVLIWLTVLLSVPSSTIAYSYGALNFSSLQLKTSIDINITIVTTRAIYAGEEIMVRMPGFTRQYQKSSSDYSNLSLSYGDLIMSPSTLYIGSWKEGTNPFDMDDRNVTKAPYGNSYFSFMPTNVSTIGIRKNITFTVYKANGIGAYCGFPGSVDYNQSATQHRAYESEKFLVTSNSTKNVTQLHVFDHYPAMGSGCKDKKYCSGNGICDFCFEKCHCYDGYGSLNDTVTTGRDLDGTCSRKVCPAGKSFADIPTAYNKAHAIAECSDKGLCNRETGLCKCFPPFTGAACERLRCPNDCSGHGQCLSMAEIALVGSLASPSFPVSYGGLKYKREAWDFDSVFGCVCDSSWTVGYEEGQTQLSEYFGPDCSLRHCPSGNNPYTIHIETDCHAKSQVYPGGVETGRMRNKCHIDCSNRGVCNYQTGVCKCFEGSWGMNCEGLAYAGSTIEYRATLEKSDNVTEIIVGN